MKYFTKDTRLNLEALSENILKLLSRTEFCVQSSKFFQEDLDYFKTFLKSMK